MDSGNKIIHLCACYRPPSPGPCRREVTANPAGRLGEDWRVVERRQETGKVPKGKKKQTGNWQEEKLGKTRK